MKMAAANADTNFDIQMSQNYCPTASRFASVSREDVDNLIVKEENQNTKKKTAYDLSIVLKFLAEERSVFLVISKVIFELLLLFCVYIINKILHGRFEIRILSSSVQLISNE